MDMKLKGKVAFVTGGASGIGRQACIIFAEEGANVVVADVQYDKAKQVAEECKKLGVDAIAPPCDVTKLSEASAAVKAAVDKFGKIDILVCCAGILQDAMIHKMTEAQWDAVMNVHLKGHWWLCHEIVPIMKDNKYGRIVLVASTAWRGTRGQSNYSSAKAAMVGLAKTLAEEMAFYGGTANVVAPGLVHTPLTDAFISNEKASKPMIDSIMLRRREDIGPLFGTTDDIASAIVYLSSDRASYITGEVLMISGGRKM
ncbi:MAG: SDR family oxidoreductase [Candidatus Lokiarchaeota archaeon]|nr:SDR family oxidoreductase [Candidatus Lokiarchaeota archaeon]